MLQLQSLAHKGKEKGITSGGCGQPPREAGEGEQNKNAKHVRQEREWGQVQQYIRYEQDSTKAHSRRVTTKIRPLMVESGQGGVIGGGPLRVLSCKEGLGEGKQNA